MREMKHQGALLAHPTKVLHWKKNLTWPKLNKQHKFEIFQNCYSNVTINHFNCLNFKCCVAKQTRYKDYTGYSSQYLPVASLDMQYCAKVFRYEKMLQS